MIRVYEPIGQIYGVTSKSKGLIQSCQTFFSLHKGFIPLSVNEHKSLVRVLNSTFAGLFFFICNNYGTKGLSTERLIVATGR